MRYETRPMRLRVDGDGSSSGSRTRKSNLTLFARKRLGIAVVVLCVFGALSILGPTGAALAAEPRANFSETAPRGTAPESSSPSEQALAEARAAFARGVTLFEKKEYLLAAAEFERALTVKRTSGLLYHLGISWMRAGRLIRAREVLREAASCEGELAQRDVNAALPDAFATIERELARLTIRAVPESAEWRVDGTVARGGEIELDPGHHSVELSAPGYESAIRELELRSGETRSEIIELKPAVPAKVVSLPPVEHDEAGVTGRAVVLWSSGILAVAGASASVVGFSLSNDEANKARLATARVDALSGGSTSACADATSDVSADCATLSSALDARGAMNTVGFVGLGVLGTGVLGVLATTFFWPDGAVKAEAEIGAQRLGFRLSGAF